MNETPTGSRRFAVIGAGIAGLACAATLLEAGIAVTIFDKGRRPGGRIATRRSGGLAFDHGAQYATARGPGFTDLLGRLELAGNAAPWPAARRPADTAWVGVPGMSALPGTVASALEREGVEIRTGRHVCWLHDGLTLRHLSADDAKPGTTQSEGGETDGPFDAILLAIPAPQAAVLAATLSPDLARQLDRVVIAPCWTVMLAFAEPVAAADVTEPADGPLGWIARDSSRPGHAPTPDRWVLHATPAWSRAHLEDDPATVCAVLSDAFRGSTETGAEPIHLAAHRWRHAKVEVPLGEACLWEAGSRIGLCGDWCLGPRVEAAFDSGVALARAALRP